MYNHSGTSHPNIENGGLPRRNQDHPYNELRLRLATTTQIGRCAARAFFNEKSLANTKLYADYTLIILVGDRNHEIAFFIRSEVIGTINSRLANYFRICVYNSNPNSNSIMNIGKQFASTFERRTVQLYSSALHGHVNHDNRCGHYTWLEIYLSFHLTSTPFDRNVPFRPNL